MTQDLKNILNPEQFAAATTVEGPILILAGAGSGKTRVLTHRIEYLVNEAGIDPGNILAVTFTNKAAGEMRERTVQLLGSKAGKVQIGTFHSTCAMVIRQESDSIGLPRNFSIYDSADQLTVIKEVMNDLRIDTKKFNPRLFRSLISRSKNSMLGPKDVAKQEGYFNELAAEVFSGYNAILNQASALDFDDLLLKPLEIFANHSDIRDKYKNKYKYILVDEFQDTNKAQFEFLLHLSGESKNLCVVGDDDQSIYGWRGADISNILGFEKYFSGTKVYKLEQNYRSTPQILDAAYRVVKNNKKRKSKRLWTEIKHGNKVTLLRSPDDRGEAENILAYMQKEIFEEKRAFKDFAILYRTNAQSRIIEDSLRREGIAYVIIGGVKFYDRKEVKDFLSYLRLILNQNDSISLRRVINYPPRGIGNVTISKIKEFALENKLLFWEALDRTEDIAVGAKQKKVLTDFKKLINKYIELQKELPLEELIRVLDDELGFRKLMKEEGTEESLQRVKNIEELFNSVSEYCEVNPGAGLQEFMENVSLVSDIDNWDNKANAVTLMTLHSAKGLEFPVVFISGCVDGLLPLIRDDDVNKDSDSSEEERRLFYVGMTRAEQRLYLLSSSTRRLYKEFIICRESPFLSEIGEENLEIIEPSYTTFGELRTQKAGTSKPRKSRKKNVKSPFLEGSFVSHKLFGKGRVLEVTPNHGDFKIVVDFGEKGIKKLLAGYANLELLS